MDDAHVANTAHEDDAPVCFTAYIDAERWDISDMFKVSHCRFCGVAAAQCEQATDRKPGDILLLRCPNRRKDQSKIMCPNWYACLNCQCRVDRKRIKKHLSAPPHLENVNPTMIGSVACVTDCSSEPFNSTDQDQSGIFTDNSTIFSRSEQSNEDHINFDFGTSLGVTQDISIPVSVVEERRSIRDDKDNNNWLSTAYAGHPIANYADVTASFDGLRNMKFFWLAEHVSDRSGLQDMVSRCFQRSEYLFGAVGKQIATKEEAIWHFKCFVQYTSMSQKQRVRQAWIVKALYQSEDSVRASIFQATRYVRQKEMPRFYGNVSKHSMWNAMPVPVIENIDGISFVSPISVVRYIFANSLEVDDVMVDWSTAAENNDDAFDATKTVQYISESKVIDEVRRTVIEKARASDLFPSTPLLLVHTNDWRDGFGSNRTKQNRKPINAWTFSVSPSKARVNSIDNTLPIAIGMKKNDAWPKVEHRFQRDMETLSKGPLLVYHGGLKKIVAVFVFRICSLEDKVERADYTSTLSCTSNYHRCFGMIIHLDPPLMKKEPLKDFLDRQYGGVADDTLNDFSWSEEFVDKGFKCNSVTLAACKLCRARNLRRINTVLSRTMDDALIMSGLEEPLNCCANWKIDSTTAQQLTFASPKNYPTVTRDGCALFPPLKREVGLVELVPVPITFALLIQGARFAFYNSSGAQVVSWNKQQCLSYLRTCGVNGKQQELIYTAAMEAHNDGAVIDYNDRYGIGSYKFPAAWIGDLSIDGFIELLMHLLFLGIAEANYALLCKYLTGQGLETFKKALQHLLRFLGTFNLSWLLAHIFSGSDKNKKGTGPWVAENWLAFTRLFKVAGAYFDRGGLKSQRRGSADVQRVIISFVALVAQLLSHAGTNKRSIKLVELYTKEFLSAVRELDYRVRHGELAVASPGPKTKEQWWLKSNYMSLLNLPGTLALLGPLVNFWDGGGKGERYIQEIKPHIPRGVRDFGMFFPRLMEKIFKLRSMGFLEATLDKDEEERDGHSVISLSSSGSDSSSVNSDRDGEPTTPNNLQQAAGGSTSTGSLRSSSELPTGDNSDDDDAPAENDGDSDSDSDSDLDDNEWHSNFEDVLMGKARIIYIYKSFAQLDQSMANHEPIAGVVMKESNGRPMMYAIYKMPRRKLGWLQIVFDDSRGASYCGLWYAPFDSEDPTSPAPRSIQDVTRKAKLSAVAIPLRYAIPGEDDSVKYAVLTNWWRERNKRGNYIMPQLDQSFYPSNSDDDDEDST